MEETREEMREVGFGFSANVAETEVGASSSLHFSMAGVLRRVSGRMVINKMGGGGGDVGR